MAASLREGSLEGACRQETEQRLKFAIYCPNLSGGAGFKQRYGFTQAYCRKETRFM